MQWSYICFALKPSILEHTGLCSNNRMTSHLLWLLIGWCFEGLESPVYCECFGGKLWYLTNHVTNSIKLSICIVCFCWPCFPPSSVSKIVRVIRQLRGNMLLIGIGGSGRQSLARLASHICEYKTFQIEVTKHYRQNEFREGECVLSVLQSNLEVSAEVYLFKCFPYWY